jgi:hypothetical protein
MAATGYLFRLRRVQPNFRYTFLAGRDKARLERRPAHPVSVSSLIGSVEAAYRISTLTTPMIWSSSAEASGSVKRWQSWEILASCKLPSLIPWAVHLPLQGQRLDESLPLRDIDDTWPQVTNSIAETWFSFKLKFPQPMTLQQCTKFPRIAAIDASISGWLRQIRSLG